MSDQIKKINFLDLESCDPAEVTSRTGCEYDDIQRQYFLNVWGHRYCVDLKTYEVRADDGPGMETYNDYLYLFILFYLMKTQSVTPSGTWVSEKDIKGGAAFFRGPHTIPADKITHKFGDDLDALKRKCEKLGGTPIDLADVAFAFNITPVLPVAVLYWQGDSDFPSEAKLLFDRTIDQHLPLDIIYALAVEIRHCLG